MPFIDPDTMIGPKRNNRSADVIVWIFVGLLLLACIVSLFAQVEYHWLEGLGLL